MAEPELKSSPTGRGFLKRFSLQGVWEVAVAVETRLPWVNPTLSGSILPREWEVVPPGNRGIVGGPSVIGSGAVIRDSLPP